MRCCLEIHSDADPTTESVMEALRELSTADIDLLLANQIEQEIERSLVVFEVEIERL